MPIFVDSICRKIIFLKNFQYYSKNLDNVSCDFCHSKIRKNSKIYYKLLDAGTLTICPKCFKPFKDEFFKELLVDYLAK